MESDLKRARNTQHKSCGSLLSKSYFCLQVSASRNGTGSAAVGLVDLTAEGYGVLDSGAPFTISAWGPEGLSEGFSPGLCDSHALGGDGS